ncbi:hypothetical protein [Bradyrhizobium stylosanthis]|uniref:hypothetical protein n=1 Tax=Bradyrhizobium stylosanthis TaxID=1803665 RepID=UPI0007C57975|nr:hypothetical protein [Bradyrhizobium stylosanthis]
MACEARLRAFDGWFRGCLTATAVLDTIIFVVLALITPERSPKRILDGTFAIAVFIVPLTFFVTCALTSVPAAILIWLGKRLRTRATSFYVGSGLLIGALFCALLFKDMGLLGVAFVLAGGPAGLVYWRVAGRYTGED